MKKVNKNIIVEEITVNDVNSMIRNQISSNLESEAFKKKIKKITSDCLSELFKALYDKKTMWKGNVER